MKIRFVTAAVLTALAWGSVGAQSTSCPAGTTTLGIPNRQEATQDACQQTYDLFQYLAPQLGAAIVGGNSTLGQGGALGGLGHFAIEARANVVWAQIPDVANFPAPRLTGSGPAQVLPTKSTFLPMATADAAIGLFGGIPLGVTNVGGIDLLVSGSYIPTVKDDNVSVTPKTNIGLGWGARFGLLSEGLLSPGVSVSYLQRNIPTTTIVGTESGTTLSIDSATIKTSAVRLVVSKNLLFIGLAAGFGKDMYSQAATVMASVGSNSSDPIAFSQKMTRNNYFVDLSVNAIIFKVVGELGQVEGGSVSTFNSFSGGPADGTRTYGSVGLRFGF